MQNSKALNDRVCTFFIPIIFVSFYVYVRNMHNYSMQQQKLILYCRPNFFAFFVNIATTATTTTKECHRMRKSQRQDSNKPLNGKINYSSQYIHSLMSMANLLVTLICCFDLLLLYQIRLRAFHLDGSIIVSSFIITVAIETII